MQRLRFAALVSIVAPLFPWSHAQSATPFAEVEAELSVDSTKEGTATIRITKLFRIVDGYLFEEPSLEANCPAPGTEVWKSAFVVGDEFAMPYRITEKSRRGIPIFRRGRGAKGEISPPPGGWVRRCASKDSPGSLEARIFAEFLSVDRQSSPTLALAGDDPGRAKSFFFGRGEDPEAPPVIRLRLTWDRGEQPANTIAVTR